MPNVWQRHYALAISHHRLGYFEPALRHARMSLLASIEVGEAVGIANALVKVAVLKRLTGWSDTTGARRMMETALRLNRASQATLSEAVTLHELALLARDEGRLDTAQDLSHRAVGLAQQAGHRRFEAFHLCRLGETLLLVDRPAARETFDRAIVLADSRYPYERATALRGRASVAMADGDPEEARRLWQEALELCIGMGVAERHDIARRLAELDSGTDQLRTSGNGGRMEE
jgi:tetratricopeptide (TPR) repeat protein